ncbi:ABC transporter ATP-binding protein [Rickettsiales bacterium]|nr:ABC transporter ATP-binding protein [Rickettsiales bacterium]
MSNANNIAVKLEKLSKVYKTKNGNKVALDEVDLEIPQGSFFGLLGPNGAGKSTLINIIAGLVNKSSGAASICGYDIDSQTSYAKKSIGVVPQELVLDPFFSMREALENTAGYYGVAKKDRKTEEIIEAVGLTEKANAPARTLSGGMRRRLLIAKALVHSPKVLVLDEPTAGVDVELRNQLWKYVTKLNENGTTILLTTHYLEEAERLCDQIAVINHGKIIANDSKKNIMKTIDRKLVTITPESAVKDIPSTLQNIKGEVSLSKNGDIEISYKADELSFDEILKSLVKAKITVKNLSTKEPDLEEIFQHITNSNIAA